MEKREKKSAAPIVAILVGCLVLLPIVYVLSIGPAWWLAVNG